jgi:hypothetical protein
MFKGTQSLRLPSRRVSQTKSNISKWQAELSLLPHYKLCSHKHENQKSKNSNKIWWLLWDSGAFFFIQYSKQNEILWKLNLFLSQVEGMQGICIVGSIRRSCSITEQYEYPYIQMLRLPVLIFCTLVSTHCEFAVMKMTRSSHKTLNVQKWVIYTIHELTAEDGC